MTLQRYSFRRGEFVGRYRLDEPLGRGGQAEVWQATPSGGAKVALKIFHSSSKALSQALLKEALAVNALADKHPAFVRVHEVVLTEDGIIALAMEMLYGSTLDEEFTALGMPLRRRYVERLAEMLLDPMRTMHEHGIVHRDIKPSNVFIQRTTGNECPVSVRILDLATSLDVGMKRVTATGTAVGTLEFMSPEQLIDTKNVGPWSDMWSVGVLLHAALTGRHPFCSPSIQIDHCDTHAVYRFMFEQSQRDSWSSEFVWFAESSVDAGGYLEGFISRCLVMDPSARYRSARDAAADLARLRSRHSSRLDAQRREIEAQVAAFRREKNWSQLLPALQLLLNHVERDDVRRRLSVEIADVAAYNTARSVAVRHVDEPQSGEQRVRLDAYITATTESNFFVGFSGEILEGGVFIATRTLLPLRTAVTLLVTLTGGFRFEVDGWVRYVREASDASEGVVNGIGVQFEFLNPQKRGIVVRFMDAREPIFYDD